MVAVATKGEIKNRTAPRCSAYSSFDRVDRCEIYPLQYPAVFDVPDRKNMRLLGPALTDRPGRPEIGKNL